MNDYDCHNPLTSRLLRKHLFELFLLDHDQHHQRECNNKQILVALKLDSYV